MVVSYLHFFSAVIYMVLAMYIIHKNPRQPINHVSSAMLVCFFIWSLMISFVNSPLTPYALAVYFENLSSLGWAYFPAFFLWFAALFGEKKRLAAQPWFFATILIVPLPLIWAQFNGQLFSHLTMEVFGWQGKWVAPWSHYFFTFYLGSVITGLVWIISYRKKLLIDNKRRQADIIIVASLAAMVLGTLTNVVFSILEIPDVPPLADVLILIWAAGLVFAISRYRFLSLTPVAAAESIVTTITDFIFLLDTQGRIAWINHMVPDYLGYQSAELEGRFFSELISVDYERDEISRSIADGTKLHNYATDLLNKDAFRLPVLISGSAIPKSGYICIVRDITVEKQAYEVLQKTMEDLEKKVHERTIELSRANDELTQEIVDRKRIEQDLLDSQERLSFLFSYAPDAYFIMDMKGTILDGNKKTEELFGYPKDELVDKNVLRMNLFASQHMPKAIRNIVRNIAGESTGPDEYLLNRKNGSKVYIEITTHPINLKGKKVVLGMARDISARRRAEAALRASEEKFRLTFENSRDAIVWLDPQLHIITHCNHACETLLECGREEIIGQDLAAFYPEDKRIFYTEEFKRFLKENRNFETDAEMVPRSAKTRSVRVTTTAIMEGEQQLIQVVCHDITEQRAAEAEKVHLEDQLRHAQKMEAIGRLAGGIAHDFNNVLGAISGYADMIKQKYGADNPKLDKYATTIFSAASRAADLTAKLLAFSRKGKIELVAVDLNETINDAITLLERTIPKNIALTAQLQADPPTVLGERIQLQNIIINLALNARDAMPGGGSICISSSLVRLGEQDINRYPFRIMPGSYYVLQVTDTGSGMDAEIRSHIFEPFFTTKERGKGTGLGLASVYGSVKSHNGFIDVDSEIGRGTRFTIYFPSVNKPSANIDATPDTLHRGSGNILVVDDEEHIRGISLEMLSDLGYRVQCCSNGEEAAAFYDRNFKDIDLVILDIIMPKMNGYACFELMKKTNPDVKVVIASGYAIDSEARRMMQQGALEFVQKPFDMKTLSRAVKKALMEKR